MRNSLEEILGTLEGTALAMEELNNSIPDIKSLYKNCNGLLEDIRKIKAEVILLQNENHKIVEDKMKLVSTIDSSLTNKANAAIKKIEVFEQQMKKSEHEDAGKSEIAKKLNNAIQKIEMLERQANKIEDLEKRLYKIEEQSKEQLKLDSQIRAFTALLDSTVKSVSVISNKITHMETEIATLKSNTSKQITSSSNSITTRAIPIIPSDCSSFLLSQPKDVLRRKPYGVLFEKSDQLIKAEHWTTLTEKLITHILDQYSSDSGEKLKASQAQDGWEHYYFYEDRQNSAQYTYIPKYNVSVFKAGSNESIKMYAEMCKEYRIPLNSVRIIYK